MLSRYDTHRIEIWLLKLCSSDLACWLWCKNSRPGDQWHCMYPRR